MATHTSQRASVAERRGVDPDISGTWENVLLEGPADAVARALMRSGDDVRVQRDVADAVLCGELPQPAGDWVILVQLHGHPWLFTAGTLGGNLDGKWVASLAKRAGTRAIHLGHEKVSGTSYVTVFDRAGRTALAYSSDGDDVTFRGTLRPRSWLKQFDPTDDFAPQDAIVRELDAFVPEFRAGTDWPRMSRGPKGRVAIETGQPDVLLPANVASAVLVDFGFGPGGPAAQATVMLGKACADDDVEAARAAIAAGANLNRKDRDGYTPLRYAILGAVRSDSRGKRALTILKLLCEAGVELNGKVKGAPSAAGIFADEAGGGSGSLRVLQALHAAGADLTLCGKDPGKSPMTSCAGHGLLPCVKFLQRIGIDPNVADRTRDTALKAARWSAGSWSRSGAPASVRKMEAMIRHLSPLRRGARMRWMQAAERGNVAELQRHLEAGQKIDAKDARGRTALLVAIDNGDAKAAKLLLDHGANPALAAESFCNLNDLDFDPARAAFLELLLDYGLDPNGGHRGMGSYVEKAVLLAVDGTGKGRTRGKEDVLKRRDVKRKGDWSDATCLRMLLDAGADVARVQRERSPGLLLYPIGNGDHPLARFLVKRGCDVNHPCGSDKTTPLMHAAEFGEVADIELLVELGADIKAKDRRGRTALALAASRPRQHAHGVVELLRTLGNDEPNKKSRRL